MTRGATAPADRPYDLRPDLTHVDTWLFDLDNTLYPIDAAFMALIDARITDYTGRVTGLDRVAARALQKRYLHEHGTTLAGLMAHHRVEPHGFLDEVHDVALDSLTPEPALHAALAALPGRRLVFTNGSTTHAARVLHHLGIDALFEAVFTIESSGLTPKPSPLAFARLTAAHAVTPRRTAFFEDSARNLEPAAALGMTTVLVGPHAAANADGFVEHRTAALADFLGGIRTSETPL